MENKLRLRVFYLSDEFALRLSNRAYSIGITTNDLVRSYIDQYLKFQKLVYIGNNERSVLRSFYLTKIQDETLNNIAVNFHSTKGKIFRSAIAQGLGF